MTNPLPPAVGDLEARLGLPTGTLADVDLARATEALEDASILAIAEAPWKGDAWTLDAPAVVKLVVLKAARREFDNPRGLSTEALGEHTVGMTDTSGVYLTPKEIAQIRRAATGQRGGMVGTVRTPSAYGDGSPWLEDFWRVW